MNHHVTCRFKLSTEITRELAAETDLALAKTVKVKLCNT